MNKLKRVVLLGFIVLSWAACKSSSVLFQSPWSATAPVIDGILSEWESPLEQPSAQAGIRYRCRHDKEFLYIAIQVTDEYARSLMLQQGATIWIDSTGRRKEKLGIGYPIPLSNSQMAAVEQEAKGNPDLFLKAYAQAFQEFDLIGLVEEPVRASNLSSKELKVAMSFDDLRYMNIEIKVPFRQFPGMAPTDNSVWYLGIAVNPPKKSIDDENSDGSLFNDRNQNTLTQSNPLMGGNPNQMRPQFAAPTRAPSMPAIWAKISFAKETE